jgi:hypothetical protein
LAGKPLVVFAARKNASTLRSTAKLEAGRAAHHWEMRRARAGRAFPVWVMPPMRDAPGLRWLPHDIAERKRMERELEQRTATAPALLVSQTLTATPRSAASQRIGSWRHHRNRQRASHLGVAVG